MSYPADVLVSVRDKARRTVPPDRADIAGTIAVTRGSKADASGAAAAALDSLTADLAAIGWVALGVDTQTGQYEPTGQVTATVALQITVRAFDLLDALGGRLSAVEHIADPGLIGGEVQHWAGTSGRPVGFASSGGETPDALSLDPVPQELTALIEARFTATGIPMARNTEA